MVWCLSAVAGVLALVLGAQDAQAAREGHRTSAPWPGVVMWLAVALLIVASSA